MALEAGTYISDLVITNPVGATDPKGQGDDHIRLIKSVLKATFPNLTGAMTRTQAQLNDPQQITLPAGTKMLFVQTAAPTGWTKDVVHNDKALRIVSGAAGTGGTVAFTTAFMSKAVVGSNAAISLTTAQLPAHAHTYSDSTSGQSVSHTHTQAGTFASSAVGDHTHSVPEGDRQGIGGGTLASGDDYTSNVAFNSTSGAAGGHSHTTTISGQTGATSADHTHTFAGSTANAGSGGTHTHTFTGTNIDLAVQYVDCIICTKS